MQRLTLLAPCGWTIRTVNASGAELSNESASAALSSWSSTLLAAAAGCRGAWTEKEEEGALEEGALDDGETGRRKEYLGWLEWM